MGARNGESDRKENRMNKLIIYVKKYFMVSALLISMSAMIIATEKSDVISKQEASAILEELKNIRGVLERIEKKSGASARAAAKPATPKVAEISSINRPSLGKSDAPVTIVEVSDYQCPFCKRFSDSTMVSLKKDYIDTGKVRLVFKDMPLPFHNRAKKVAQAAHCAGDQGKYWQMHDQIFSDIKKYSDEDLLSHAQQLKLDEGEFKTCLDSKRHLESIEKDIADASKAGLSGTPSFVIGKTTSDVIKGDVVIGAQPISSLKKYIEKYL